MLLALQITAVFLVGIAMSMALAHAMEYPGKLRLDEPTYRAVQTIYYPGFTIGGAAEPLAIVATLVLALVTRNDSIAFRWTLSAFAALAAMHTIFWTVTQPTNRHWLKDQQLSAAGKRFFAVERKSPRAPGVENTDWVRLRDQWEYSHVARAILSVFSLLALVVAIAH
jgi:anthrone oxygenase-like protein